MKHLYCGSGYLSTGDATTWNNTSGTECKLGYASVKMPEISKLQESWTKFFLERWLKQNAFRLYLVSGSAFCRQNRS